MTRPRTTTLAAAQAAYDNAAPDDSPQLIACRCDSCGHEWNQEDAPKVCPECSESDEEELSGRAVTARRRQRRWYRTEGD